MISRQVTKTKKDEDGDILALCNPFSTWSPRWKSDAIADIEKKIYRYYLEIDNKEVNIHVVKGSRGKYLRTDPDKTVNNNLDYLPDC